MTFGQILKTGLIAGMVAAAASLGSLPAQSGHQRVYINNQPVDPADLARIQRAIGMALPGGAYY